MYRWIKNVGHTAMTTHWRGWGLAMVMALQVAAAAARPLGQVVLSQVILAQAVKATLAELLTYLAVAAMVPVMLVQVVVELVL